jgi:two-component system nitrate/nitrite response regulator NarL
MESPVSAPWPEGHGAEEPAGTPWRVLLVDDHALITEILQQRLSAEPDLEVVAIACSVEAAVSVMQVVEVDVAVIDYRFPGDDGIVLAERIRERYPDTKMLLLTGTPDDRMIVRAIEAGFHGVLTKDRGFTELIDAVRAIATGERWLSGALLGRVLGTASKASGPTELTRREIEVLELAARGMQNAAIAKALYLSVNTVRNHMQSGMAKLGAHSKLEAVAIAVRKGIISFPA